jgi:hypothetical protein
VDANAESLTVRRILADYLRRRRLPVLPAKTGLDMVKATSARDRAQRGEVPTSDGEESEGETPNENEESDDEVLF